MPPTPLSRRAVAASFLLLASGAAASAAAETPAVAPTPDFPAVVARVEGIEIRRAELVTEAGLRRAEAITASGEDPGTDPAFYRKTLDGLIAETLLYVDAKRRGAVATGAEVEAAVGAMRGGFADEAALDAALGRQGTSLADVRRQLERTLTVEKVVRAEIAPGVKVDEAAKRALYEKVKERFAVPARYRARHILIRVPPAATAEDRVAARRKAAEQLAKVRAGADFAALARQVSEDPTSAGSGGEMGWIVPTGGAATDLDEALKRLAPGQTEVVETAAGLHVVQLVETRPAGPRDYEELAPDLEAYLKKGEVRRAVAERVAALRPGARIEVFLAP